MRSYSKLLVMLVVSASVIIMVISKEMDLEKFLQWEFIFLIILGVSICFLFMWRRSMRLKDTPVSIQLLDD